MPNGLADAQATDPQEPQRQLVDGVEPLGDRSDVFDGYAVAFDSSGPAQRGVIDAGQRESGRDGAVDDALGDEVLLDLAQGAEDVLDRRAGIRGAESRHAEGRLQVTEQHEPSTSHVGSADGQLTAFDQTAKVPLGPVGDHGGVGDRVGRFAGSGEPQQELEHRLTGELAGSDGHGGEERQDVPSQDVVDLLRPLRFCGAHVEVALGVPGPGVAGEVVALHSPGILGRRLCRSLLRWPADRHRSAGVQRLDRGCAPALCFLTGGEVVVDALLGAASLGHARFEGGAERTDRAGQTARHHATSDRCAASCMSSPRWNSISDSARASSASR